MSKLHRFTHGDKTIFAEPRTDVGKVRKVNEDDFCISDRVWAVSDGMGGHQAGDIASSICVAVCAEVGQRDALTLAGVGEMIAEANDAVRAQAASTDRHGMGATLVGVALADNGGEQSFVVFNVGDSRCYELVDDEPMRQVTRDHSLVQELVDAGQISADDAESHPERNVITRGIGIDPHAQADLVVLDDRSRVLVLCSDGVHGEVSRGRIEAIVRSAPNVTAAADGLLAASLDGPARDNATVLVLEVTTSSVQADQVDETTGPRPESRSDVTTAPRDLLATGPITAGDKDDAPEAKQPDSSDDDPDTDQPTLIDQVPS